MKLFNTVALATLATIASSFPLEAGLFPHIQSAAMGVD